MMRRIFLPERIGPPYLPQATPSHNKVHKPIANSSASQPGGTLLSTDDHLLGKYYLTDSLVSVKIVKMWRPQLNRKSIPLSAYWYDDQKTEGSFTYLSFQHPTSWPATQCDTDCLDHNTETCKGDKAWWRFRLSHLD